MIIIYRLYKQQCRITLQNPYYPRNQHAKNIFQLQQQRNNNHIFKNSETFIETFDHIHIYIHTFMLTVGSSSTLYNTGNHLFSFHYISNISYSGVFTIRIQSFAIDPTHDIQIRVLLYLCYYQEFIILEREGERRTSVGSIKHTA